jgi:hypothetical protein
MDAPVAFCPQCKSEVVFLKEQNLRRCPLCGFQFETGRTMAPYEPSQTMTFLGALLRVFLIMVVIVVVLVGVVFVGCVTAFKF